MANGEPVEVLHSWIDACPRDDLGAAGALVTSDIVVPNARLRGFKAVMQWYVNRSHRLNVLHGCTFLRRPQIGTTARVLAGLGLVALAALVLCTGGLHGPEPHLLS
jgi:hypothetical protein